MSRSGTIDKLYGPVPVPGKKVPRQVIRGLIKSGRITVVNGDTSQLDALLSKQYDEAIKPVDNDLKISWPDRPTKPRRPTPARHTRIRVVKDKSYTESQLEHFGDAIAYIANRQLAHDKFGKDTKLYFLYSSALCSNANMKTCPGAITGASFEIIIGDTYVRLGIEEALNLAIEMLKKTDAYKQWDKNEQTTVP